MNQFDPREGIPLKEPSADVRAAASQIRQMYLALVSEGFEEHQALMIMGYMMAGGKGQ